MTRQQYLSPVIRLYLDAPGSPPKPSRRDWAIASDLYRLGVSLPDLEHAIRLATLRRQLTGIGSHPTIRSLAYYRTVLLSSPNRSAVPTTAPTSSIGTKQLRESPSQNRG